MPPSTIELRELLAKATDDCILWPGPGLGNGYGYARSFGRRTTAHRAIMELSLGRKLGRFEYVCHRCDVRQCANIRHLFVGSPADNAQDMVAKGRGNYPRPPQVRQRLSESVKRALREGRFAPKRGEASTTAKLTDDDVRAIRASTKSQSALARDYGVTQSLISQIKLRKVWAHV